MMGGVVGGDEQALKVLCDARETGTCSMEL